MKIRLLLATTFAIALCCWTLDRPRAAAKELGIGSTALKAACRKLGIIRWPYSTSGRGRKSVGDSELSATGASSEEEQELTLNLETLVKRVKVSNGEWQALVADLSTPRSDVPWRSDVRAMVHDMEEEPL